MKIGVIGTGYVGLVTGACFSDVGNEVVCYDIDQNIISDLQKGIVNIYEHGLKNKILDGIKSSKLSFSNDIKKICDNKDIIFIAVGTPGLSNGETDLTYIFAAAENIGKTIESEILVIVKSTVPVGTTFRIRDIIKENIKKRNLDLEISVVNNPEFLREGNAVSDFLNPERIIIGAENKSSVQIIKNLYKPFSLSTTKFIGMDVLSSEMTKYASNAMLATRISFMNEISRICEVVGANVNDVRRGMGADSRIGYKYLYPSVGYGGSCFPKDLASLSKVSTDRGYNPKIINATIEVNSKQIIHFTNRLLNYLESCAKDSKTVSIWGLSFKPETDDIREAPSLYMIRKLIKNNITVKVYDPKAVNKIKDIFCNKIHYYKTKYDALLKSDVLVVLTEWKEFKNPQYKKIIKAMETPVIFDGRNIYNKNELNSIGIEYYQIGFKDKY